MICMKKIIMMIVTITFFISGVSNGSHTAFDNFSHQKSFIDGYDFMIITPEKFTDALQPLVNHKNNLGINTSIITIKEIYNQYPGRDDAEKIKYCIKEMIETKNISYVLLVGSVDILPIRTSSVQWYGPDNETLVVEDIITDLYYADIYDENGSFCSWDSNENDIFGEAIYYTVDSGDPGEMIDAVDLYPDIGIGRLPCTNTRELKICIDKIINYETQTYNSQWFNNMLLMGGDQFLSSSGWDDDKINEGEIVIDQIAQIRPEFTHIKLKTSKHTFHPFRVNYEINKGVGFVGYSGHGFPNGFGLHPHEKERLIKYYSPYLLGIHNSNKLPVVYFHACLTAKLDYNKWGIKLPCIAWNFVKMRYGGAIATIGSTRTGYSYTTQEGAIEGGSRLIVEFFKAYEPGIIISDMFNEAQSQCLQNTWHDAITMEEYNLIGDPSLKIGGYQ